MKPHYTMVTRPPRGPTGRREIGFVAAIGSNVFMSMPVPGEPLPGRYNYRDAATASRDGWIGAVVAPFIGSVRDPAHSLR